MQVSTRGRLSWATTVTEVKTLHIAVTADPQGRRLPVASWGMPSGRQRTSPSGTRSRRDGPSGRDVASSATCAVSGGAPANNESTTVSHLNLRFSSGPPWTEAPHSGGRRRRSRTASPPAAGAAA